MTKITTLAAVALGVALLLTGTPATQSARGGTQLTLDWSMPDRYGDANHDGFADTVYPPDGQAQIDPGSWRADLTVSGADCSSSTQRTWWIEGTKIVAGDPRLLSPTAGGCSLSYSFPAEGVYEVAFAERDGNGKLLGSVKKPITVQDFLIVSIGDSVASGEGNPEVPSLTSPSWENGSPSAAECHRSRYAGTAQAALALEQADPHSSVTFVHLACSGATIVRGLLNAEAAGQGPVDTDQPAQLDQLKPLIGKREVDALFLSIGANDVRFSDVVTSCLIDANCDDPTIQGSAAQKVAVDSARLPGHYATLANALTGLGIDAQRVYFSEYFDPTHDDAGAICDGSILFDWFRNPTTKFSITGKEAQWASTSLVGGMNQIGAAAAAVHGWNRVGGITSQFLDHGYCANDHWVVRASESLKTQGGDKNGTLHPNHSGQAVYGTALSGAAHNDLLPGAAALPRRPFQRLVLQGQNPSSFDDVVDNVAPGTAVQLRVQLNGKDTNLRTVSYSLQGPGSLSTTTGTTDSNGQSTFTYTAPSAPTGCDDGPVCGVVTASFADVDGQHTDALSVGVSSPVSVAVLPKSVTIPVGQSTGFTATVTGTSNQEVSWNATGGTIDANGTYTAGTTPGTFSVTATSKADAGAFDTATVMITAAATGVRRLSSSCHVGVTSVGSNDSPPGPTSFLCHFSGSTTESQCGPAPNPCCIAGGSANAMFDETSSGSDLQLVHVTSDGSASAAITRGTWQPGDAPCEGGAGGSYDIRFTVSQTVAFVIHATLSGYDPQSFVLLTAGVPAATLFRQSGSGTLDRTLVLTPGRTYELQVQAAAAAEATASPGDCGCGPTGSENLDLQFGFGPGP
jgi:hypothetical protein